MFLSEEARKQRIAIIGRCAAVPSIRRVAAANVREAALELREFSYPIGATLHIKDSDKQSEYLGIMRAYKEVFEDLVFSNVDNGVQMVLGLLFHIASREAENRAAKETGMRFSKEVEANSRLRLKNLKKFAHYCVDFWLESISINYGRQGRKPKSESTVTAVAELLRRIDLSEVEIDKKGVKNRIESIWGGEAKVPSIKKTVKRHELATKNAAKKQRTKKQQ